MSVLASLVRAYDRLDERGQVPPFGYSVEKIGFVISLNADGTVANVTDVRDASGKKKQPRMMQVPQPAKRTSGIAPNFLWDKTSYVFGITAGDGKRVAEEHAAFVKNHLDALDGADDPGLHAMFLFLKNWTPDRFAELEWPEEMRDQNVVFALESERLQKRSLHDRPAAKALWAKMGGGAGTVEAICLVTGTGGPIARLHPAVKGVWGAQTAGASIVSFNLDAFTSYGHEQGDNAPVSEVAAFKYTTALNHFLAGRKNRVQIGDASTVFWADASNVEAAEEAESIFGAFMAPDEEAEAGEVGDRLKLIRKGVPLREIEPALATGVRFNVLGLSPNAARLSVRYWFEDDFGVLTENYQRYVADMRLEPQPAKRMAVTVRSLVLRTAPARIDSTSQVKFDADQISPLLAGEIFRSILTGARFPESLLPTLLMRIRADHLLDSIRISLIKAVLVRTMRIEDRLPMNETGVPKEDYLVRSDPDDPNPARRLGRLFALVERAQLAALGDKVNVTVKDKFLGSVAATPRQVFAKLVLNAEQHHLKKLRNGHSDAGWIKDSNHARGVGAALNRDIGRLWATFDDGLPAQHSNEEQGLFLVGYYQERYGRKAEEDGGVPDETAQTNDIEE
ncbi:type I-C CRISPR-associated protein Cas8c/Csd1 [Mesorhizobium sp. Root157]|uniref:type I-C CRISPR-associated protein Cas8c/Csd1 n=1 Tax=Mesorhizobium sp. Root157 TaxID=1736477 RepID=UPI0006F27D00|nr:type I-C CRISPR-associated protein Cas8c/Csd1 [Mesorhizobium sp. Root157]KQZ84769.1 type I-C CRISPR-associated protein Cas8c/Csd1 [Mesorhizobium sp. Root157]